MMDKYNVSIAIAEKNKKALWEILENFDGQLMELDDRTSKSHIEEVKSLITALQSVVEWAEDYPNSRVDLQRTTKLWEIARDFIVSKGLQDEFNIIANKKM